MTSIQKPSNISKAKTAQQVSNTGRPHDRLKVLWFTLGVLILSLSSVSLIGSISAVNIWAGVISVVILAGSVWFVRKNSDWADSGLEYTAVATAPAKEKYGVQQ